MKKNILVIIGIFLIITLSVSNIFCVINIKNKNEEIKSLKEENEELSDENENSKTEISSLSKKNTILTNQINNETNQDSNSENYNRLVTIEYKDLEDLISKKEDFILLASQTSCSHCISYKPILNSTLEKKSLIAYTIEIDGLSSKERTSLYKIVNISGTPTTIFFEKGEENINNRLVGSVSEEKIIETLKKADYIK